MCYIVWPCATPYSKDKPRCEHFALPLHSPCGLISCSSLSCVAYPMQESLSWAQSTYCMFIHPPLMVSPPETTFPPKLTSFEGLAKSIGQKPLYFLPIVYIEQYLPACRASQVDKANTSVTAQRALIAGAMRKGLRLASSSPSNARIADPALPLFLFCNDGEKQKQVGLKSPSVEKCRLVLVIWIGFMAGTSITDPRWIHVYPAIRENNLAPLTSVWTIIPKFYKIWAADN